MKTFSKSKYNLEIFETPKVIDDKDLKITLEIQNGLQVSKSFLDNLLYELKNLDKKIVTLLLSKNMSIFVGHKFSDLYLSQAINKNYGYKIDFDDISRGVMSDEIDKIVLFSKNLQPEHIGAILLHEIGHFVDAFQNFGNINTDSDLTYSSNLEFISAYKKDFQINYEMIKNDKNPYLKHFVQDSVPDKINQMAIIETFAELFRLAFGKVNNTKTVELYFPNTFNIIKKSLKEDGFSFNN